VRLEGKVAFITGATSGIGAVMARRFAAQGASVVIAARREDRGQAVVEEIRSAGGRAAFQRMDTAIEADVRASIEFAVGTFGKLDVLVNNAGPVDLIQSGTDRRAHELSSEAFDRIVQLLAPDAHPEAQTGPAPAPHAAASPALAQPAAPAPDRLSRLEAEVARLRRQLEGLAERLGEPLPG